MQIPAEWFDQFPPLEPGAKWDNAQWCPRHWAPCPNLGANGIGAAAEVMQAFLDGIAGAGSTPAELNRQMANVGRVCCYLGDERMYEIWGHWPPALPPKE